MQTGKKLTDIVWQASTIHHRTRRFTVLVGEALRTLLLFPLLRGLTPLNVEGSEHLQGEGPYIFASNHSSHLDTPVLLAALPRRVRLRVAVAAAADYFFTSRWRSMLVSLFLNAFAFERYGSASASSLLKTRQFLDEGQSLILFPEGTRTQDGQIQHFKTGVGRLALSGTIKVIPTWINGTYQALPKGANWPRRQRVTVSFGAPLTFAQETDPVKVTEEIEQEVRALVTNYSSVRKAPYSA